MSIIESVKNYLESCPCFYGKAININYLPPENNSFSVENVPVSPIVKRYSDGESIMQFCFILAGRFAYDGDILENLNLAQLFEEFEGWIERQNSLKNLPDLSDMGLASSKIEVTKSGTLHDTARTSARFQTELRLLYKKS